ncbi:enolase C-terminal domain-like protein [Blastococcus brunescens]|uniref:Enolase C-terminal domain-like protein n=1 Tax=Blastococcus brunescens TaxID=1564165 RepID=A0ABZ1AWC6_9ACTN|nr:enolase C-terminal domain-like protein [Blastococcus sp. BMG 8361]WRL62865.1 enolase C-terminal domain-like protein [Blastococcus sp. BMG 8361]
MSAIRRVRLQTLGWTRRGRAFDRFLPVASDTDSESPGRGWVLTIESDAGTGRHVWSSGINGFAAAAVPQVANWLLGQDPFQRERIWSDLSHFWRKHDRTGIGCIDIALWDLAGRAYGVGVSQLLGGYRTTLPAYVSTLHGAETGSLSAPEDYADFAVQCADLGYTAFKIHGWNGEDIPREVANVLGVRAAVGERMALMLDPSCGYSTFADALRVGRACDEAGFFWYEDPYREGGISVHAHRRLGELLTTPLLLGEHVRGFAAHVDQIAGRGTDFVRADADLDGGITGVMKIAHAAEGFGLDVELHGPGPAHRACMSAIRNTNFYELALSAPSLLRASDDFPVYLDYSDDVLAAGPGGTFPVPVDAGLGVELDEDWIGAHVVDEFVAD